MSYFSNKAADPLNLGWFATPEALFSAYPVGADGYFAMVGTTDTFWTWDSGSNSWVDTSVGGAGLTNLDGGRAGSTYLITQNISGGAA